MSIEHPPDTHRSRRDVLSAIAPLVVVVGLLCIPWYLAHREREPVSQPNTGAPADSPAARRRVQMPMRTFHFGPNGSVTTETTIEWVEVGEIDEQGRVILRTRHQGFSGPAMIDRHPGKIQHGGALIPGTGRFEWERSGVLVERGQACRPDRSSIKQPENKSAVPEGTARWGLVNCRPE